MRTVSIEFPDEIFAAVRKDPNEFAQELRIVAAVKWYELGEISQGRASEIARLTRSEFINALSRFKVTPFQYTDEDLAAELANAN
jgi:predicted HTH domain antitoxin